MSRIFRYNFRQNAFLQNLGGDGSVASEQEYTDRFILKSGKTSAIRILFNMAATSARAESSWFVIPPNMNTAAMRLFCFPYAGGGTWIFRQWPGLLGETIAVCPVKLPGRADRLREAPATDLHGLADTMARSLAPSLQPPYAFFGCSMGALLAYECAHRLVLGGAPNPSRLIVAAAPAPAQVSITQPLHRLPDKPFLAAVQSQYDNPMMAAIDEEMLPLVLPGLRGDMTMYETYQARPDTPPLPFPISAIGGLKDGIPETGIRAWRNHTAASFAAHMLPGGHFLVHEQETALAALVRTELTHDAPI
jgi:medium-chain acyl-[acyl-carrier-protein] hydrolase